MADIFSGISSLHQALDYHLDRHNVLTSNLAHVDTPGYHPRDLERIEPGSFASVLSVTMARTDAHHLPGASTETERTGRVFIDPAGDAGNDQNAVSLDREAAKIAANQIRYDVLSTVAGTQLSELAFAAADGRGA